MALKILFKLMRSQRHVIPFYDTVVCTKLLVELGCRFSHLSTDVHNYFDNLAKLLMKRTEEREKLELLMLAYHCCRNSLSDYRFKVSRFTEAIGQHIHGVFKVELNEEAKITLFKLMDLALLVHSPNLASDGKLHKFVADEAEWNLHLRNFVYIAELELKLPPKTKHPNSGREPEVNHIFAQFAARLFFLTKWDETIQPEDENDEPSSSKRVKRTQKLQSLMDYAQSSADPSEFNWKWLTIISEMIYNYPAALTNEDYQPLLQMLSHCQPTIEYDFQIYAFAKCCFVLLQRDESFTATTNAIVANLCRDLWHKIADGAARVCASNSKNPIKSHVLLQLLIHHHKYSSPSFIEDVIKIFLSMSIIKCDTTLQTLVTILTSFNLDSLANGKELAAKILAYTLEKTKLLDLMKNLKNTSAGGKPSVRVLAQVAVTSCLSKTDLVNYCKHSKLDGEKLFDQNWKLDQQAEYRKEVAEIIHQILLKSTERLLIEDEDFLKGSQDDLIEDKKMSVFPPEIKCIIDEVVYDKLPGVTEFKGKLVDQDSDIDLIKDYLKSVMKNNEFMMNLANCFLEFEAFNEEDFRSSFILKKIDFHMQEIDGLFKFILGKRNALDLQDTDQLLTLVQALFANNYHKKICKKIRSYDLNNCIRWISKQANHNFVTYEEDDQVTIYGWKEFAGAKMEEKIKFMAIRALCEYNNFAGQNTELLVDRFARIEIDCLDNFDLHAVFDALKILGRQKSVPEGITQWAWKHIVPICLEHNSHQYLSSRIIGALRQIICMSKGHDDMANNVITLFSSFAQKSTEYSPEVAVELIKQIKYFHEVRLLILFENS